MKHILKKVAACLVLFLAANGAAKALTTTSVELVAPAYAWSLSGWQSGVLNETFSQTTGQLSTTLAWVANPQTYGGSGIEQAIGFNTPPDWSGYQTISIRYKLTSTSSTVTSDGYPFEISLYDSSGLHELPGSSGSVDQDKTIMLIADGAWHTYVLDIRELHRAAINTIAFWFSNPYTTTYSSTLLISNVTVTGQTPLFDGKGMSSNLTAPATKTVADTVSTSDNLNLQLTSQGALVGVTKGTGTPVAWGNNAQPGGFLVRDNSSTAAPTQLLGSVSSITGGYSVTANSTSLHLNTTAQYTTSGNMIHVNLSATNTTTSTNRYLTYYLALPVKTSSTTWQWSSDILTNKTVGTASNIEELTYRYPVQTLCGTSGANTVGLSMAVPLNEPQNYRLAYNESTGILYAAFDIALTNVTKSAGGNFNTGTADIYIYACDPAWGIRSALQTYYTNFSSWFTKRIAAGGWNVWGDGGDNSLTYVWGGNPAYYAANNAVGAFNFEYVFANYIDVGVNDLATPSRAAITTRLTNLAAANSTELSNVEALSYSPAVYGGLNSNSIWTGAGKAAVASSYYDANGHLVTDLNWQGSYGAVAQLPANLVMAIPNGDGAFQWSFMQALKAVNEPISGGTVNGWAFDGTWPDYSYDYHSAAFTYMPFPLSFDRDATLAVSVPTRLAFASWMGSVNALDTTKAMFINATPDRVRPVTFMAPYVDIFGNEQPAVTDPAYSRQLAGPSRDVCYLPYSTQPDNQAYYHLLYNIHPGTGLASYQFAAMNPVLNILDAGGWQPVTNVTSSVAGIRLERYGSGSTYFVVCYNPGASSSSFNMVVNTAAMGTPVQVTEIFGSATGTTITGSGGSYPLTLTSGQTRVFAVQNTTGAATVTFTVAPISADTDALLAQGSQTILDSHNFGGDGSYMPVNGLYFTGITPANDTDFNITMTGIGSWGVSTGTTGSGPFAALTSGYQGMIGYTLWASAAGTPVTLTVGNLIPGEHYTVRMWQQYAQGAYGEHGIYTSGTSTSGPVYDNYTYYLAGSGNTTNAYNGIGEYVTASFTAASTSQTFSVQGYHNDGTASVAHVSSIEVVQGL